MFSLQAKLIAAAIALALLGGAIWRYHYVTQRLDTVTAERDQAQADYSALRTDYDRERKLAKDATNDYESRLARLNAAKPDTPAMPVRLCRSPTGYVPATAVTAIGAAPGAAGEQPGAVGSDVERGVTAGPDIGPALYALADEADERAAQCNALISWARSIGAQP